MKQLIEGETVGDGVTLWGSGPRKCHISYPLRSSGSWCLSGRSNLNAEVSTSPPNHLFLRALLLLYLTSLLLPPAWGHPLFFLTQDIKLPLRVNFSRQSYSRAYFFEVYCVLSLLQGRRNLRGHRKVGVRNIHMRVQVRPCGHTHSHLMALYSGTVTHLP